MDRQRFSVARLLCAALFIQTACQEEPITAPSQEGPLDGPSRVLVPAHDREVNGMIFVNGVQLTNPSGFSVTLSTLSGRTLFDGSSIDRIVTKSPSIVQSGVFGISSGNFGYKDGFENESTSDGYGTVFNSAYTLSLSEPYANVNCPSLQIGFNHLDTGPTNGNFLDVQAGDQNVEFIISTTAGSCQARFASSSPFQHPIAASPLSVSISAPDTVFVNQSFTLTGSATGGHSVGTKQYAWKESPTGGNTEDFAGISFVSGSSITRSYTTPGSRTFRVLVRDGNNSGGQGGNLALSAVKTVVVRSREVLDAEPAGHTIPGNVTTGTIYATSVSMKNRGTETWSGSSFTLKQVGSSGWTPQSVAFGTGSTATEQTKVFNFNLSSPDPGFCDWQPNFWKMNKTGVGVFGQQNGSQVFVKCGSGGPVAALAPSFSRGFNLSGADPTWLNTTRPVVQQLRQDQLRVPFDENGKAAITYVAALDAEWGVDFHLYVKYDPATIQLGQFLQGIRGVGYVVSVEHLGTGEVVFHGTRRSAGGLNGQGLILAVPIITLDGALPVLEVVDLVVTQ